MPSENSTTYDKKIETVGSQHTVVSSHGKPGNRSAAQSRYSISGAQGAQVFASITFQRGSRARRGVNGCTLQDVVAVALDRVRQLQGGRLSSRKLELAGQKLEEALLLLQARK